jgi:hypothetical protein
MEDIAAKQPGPPMVSNCLMYSGLSAEGETHFEWVGPWNVSGSFLTYQ